jgi:hypothetical protein
MWKNPPKVHPSGPNMPRTHRLHPPREPASNMQSPPPLDKHGTKRLQEVIGTFLFYRKAVNNTMLEALETLATAQIRSSPAPWIMQQLTQMPRSGSTKSDMILFVHSDASYLTVSEPKTRSRVGGYFYLGNQNEAPLISTLNGPIYIASRVMKHAMAAASEAEIGALFHNGQEAAHNIRTALKEIGREQTEPTRMITDKTTADGLANKRTKIRRSRAMDMRFYWIQDRVDQKQIRIHWLKGDHADYVTKHH